MTNCINAADRWARFVAGGGGVMQAGRQAGCVMVGWWDGVSEGWKEGGMGFWPSTR